MSIRAVGKLRRPPVKVIRVDVSNPHGKGLPDLTVERPFHALSMHHSRDGRQHPTIQEYPGDHLIVRYEAVPGGLCNSER